jgi:guanylate kinase
VDQLKIGGPLLVVVSGPSGVGKDAVIERMRGSSLNLYFTVTVTTRHQRQGEVDGRDYHFISKNDFENMIEKDELLEWANVYGNYYGVPKEGLRKAVSEGSDAVVKVDVQGADTIKGKIPDAVMIFVSAPSSSELEKRLVRRKTETGVDLELRTQAAKDEMKRLPLFDYVVVNHDEQVELAVYQIEAIITAEKCRVKARTIEI